jgi:hypothetical protein
MGVLVDHGFDIISLSTARQYFDYLNDAVTRIRVVAAMALSPLAAQLKPGSDVNESASS